jgi:hypothetical protein
MSNEVVIELDEVGQSGKIVVNGQQMRYVTALRIEAAAGEFTKVHLTFSPSKIITRLSAEFTLAPPPA